MSVEMMVKCGCKFSLLENLVCMGYAVSLEPVSGNSGVTITLSRGSAQLHAGGVGYTLNEAVESLVHTAKVIVLANEDASTDEVKP